MEKAETKSGLVYDIHVAEVWPDGERPTCIAKGPDSDGRATIVKHRDCPEADLAAMRGWFESEWQGRADTN